MAVTNVIRAWNSYVLSVNSNPTIPPGASAGIGSIAIDSIGNVYTKTGVSDTSWTLSTSGGLQKGVKTIFCIDNGDYATLQDAINAASNGDTILVGAKSGGWGNITIPAQLSINISGLQSPKAISVEVGTITFSPNVGSAVQNTVYLSNLFINSASGNNLTFSGTAPARLRIAGCFLYNGGAGTTATVSNSGVGSSAYFENCIILADSAVPVQFSISSVYTRIYYCTLDRGSVAMNVSGSFVECLESQFRVDVASSIINLTSSGVFSGTLNLISNSTTNGSGINLDASSTIVDVSNTYSIATGTGYCLLGTGTQIYGPIITTNSVAIPANVKIQNTIVRLPLTLTLTASP